MAKQDEKKAKLTGNGTGKGRMQIFVAGFALEGGDDVLAEGFKAINHLTTAMAQAGVLAPMPMTKAALAAPKPSTTTSTTAATVDTAEPAEAAVVPDAGEEVEDDTVADTTTTGGQKRPYSYKTPKYMDDLDFSKATMSLEDFAKEKGNPTDIMDKYLLTVVWFKKHMGIEEVTIGHIYTAFDNVGWKSEMPVNPSVPLRDLKSKRHVLTREQGAEGYKVNFKGEQTVEKMGK